MAMTNKQANTVKDQMLGNTSVFALFQFWLNGNDGEGTFAEYLREIANALDTPPARKPPVTFEPVLR